MAGGLTIQCLSKAGVLWSLHPVSVSCATESIDITMSYWC